MKFRGRRLNRKGKIWLSGLILIICALILLIHLISALIHGGSHQIFNHQEPKTFKQYMTDREHHLENDNLNMQNENYDVSIYDVDQKKSYHWTKGTTDQMFTASTIKVPILVELLHQKSTLSANEKQLVQGMIRKSSNKDAQALFEEIGGAPALNKMFKRLKMDDSQASSNWWLSTMSSKDYVKLLKNIFVKSDHIGIKNRKYIVSEMSKVNHKQRWGIGHFSKDGLFMANKNGWTLNNTWIMDSTGAVMVNGHLYLIAIMSDNHPDGTGSLGLSKAKKEMNQIAQYAGKYVLDQ